MELFGEAAVTALLEAAAGEILGAMSKLLPPIWDDFLVEVRIVVVVVVVLVAGEEGERIGAAVIVND